MKTSTHLISAFGDFFLAMVLLSQVALNRVLAGGSHWLGAAEEASAVLEETTDSGFFLNEAKSNPFTDEAFSIVIGAAAHRLDLTNAVEARQPTVPIHHSRGPPSI